MSLVWYSAIYLTASFGRSTTVVVPDRPLRLKLGRGLPRLVIAGSRDHLPGGPAAMEVCQTGAVPNYSFQDPKSPASVAGWYVSQEPQTGLLSGEALAVYRSSGTRDHQLRQEPHTRGSSPTGRKRSLNTEKDMRLSSSVKTRLKKFLISPSGSCIVVDSSP